MEAVRIAQSDLRTELQAMGLTDEVLLDVVVQGEAERCPRHHWDAPNRGGMLAYYGRVYALRAHLVACGWVADNSHNLCRTLSPCGRHAVITVTGDSFTGRDDVSPQPQFPRGATITYAVNAAQGELFDDALYRAAEETRLWFLLVHHDSQSQEVRCELSLPEAIDEKGGVTCWVERNILEPIDAAGAPDMEDVELVEEIVDVPVSRKR